MRTVHAEQIARARASSIGSSEKNRWVSEARGSAQRAPASISVSTASRGVTPGRRAEPAAGRSTSDGPSPSRPRLGPSTRRYVHSSVA